VRRTALVALLVLALGLAPGMQGAEAEGALLARSYAVRYRSLSDAAELVTRALSTEGSLKLQPRLKTIVVEDHAVVLERVDDLLREFDLPPRNVEVTLTLFVGTDTREPQRATGQGIGPREISREVRGVGETLGDFTKWTSYELLGSQSVTGVEGHPVTARISGEYRVSFEVGGLEPPSAKAPQGMITFKTLVLQRVSRTPAGEEKADDLYSTAIQLHVGKQLMVGAARSPESRKALFLTIKARPV
jgi:hypothetical protein